MAEIFYRADELECPDVIGVRYAVDKYTYCPGSLLVMTQIGISIITNLDIASPQTSPSSYTEYYNILPIIS